MINKLLLIGSFPIEKTPIRIAHFHPCPVDPMFSRSFSSDFPPSTRTWSPRGRRAWRRCWRWSERCWSRRVWRKSRRCKKRSRTWIRRRAQGAGRRAQGAAVEVDGGSHSHGVFKSWLVDINYWVTILEFISLPSLMELVIVMLSIYDHEWILIIIHTWWGSWVLYVTWWS